MKTKEELFLEIINNLEFKEVQNNIFHYFKDNRIYFIYDKKTKTLNYNYNTFYWFFRNEYDMQNNEVDQFIKDQMYKYFKLDIVTTDWMQVDLTPQVYKYFKLFKN